MRRTFRFASMLLSVCMLFSLCVRAESPEEVRLLCLNIGKADCMLLFWQDKTYLIDAGREQTYPALEQALSQYGVQKLDGVFVTHCHKDHMGGLDALADSDLPVDAWYAAGIYYDLNGDVHPAEAAARSRNTEVAWLKAGDMIDCGSGASFTVLGPLSCNVDNENNNSLVLRFDSTAGSILLAGDMKDEEEYELLSAGAFTACDVLKVGHHGDNNASGKEMLSVVRPKAAIILTNSAEEPDTPAGSTLKRLRIVGAEIYVSQNYSDALLLTLRNGVPSVEDIQWDGVPGVLTGVGMKIDLSDDTLTLFNRSNTPVDLSGCRILSTQGDETLTLSDVVLDVGGSCVIGSKSTQGEMDLKWNDKKVWHRSKRDMAILYDAYGRPAAYTDNGFAE